MSFRFRKELSDWVLEPNSDAVTVSDKPSPYAGYTIVRQDYLDSVHRQIDRLREEVKRLRSPIKDYKIDAVAWNAERASNAPRRHWIDTVDYRVNDPWR